MCKKCKGVGHVYVFYHYTIPGTCNAIAVRYCDKCEKGKALQAKMPKI